MKSMMQVLLLLLTMVATVPARAVNCEFTVPAEDGVFKSTFKVVGTGGTSERALADAINKCFARYERANGGKVPDNDNTRKAIDLCANPPGC